MLKSTAQLYVVEDEASMATPAPLPVVEVVEPETPGFEVVEQPSVVEVSEPSQEAVVTIVIDDLPGAPKGTKDPVIEVEEEEDSSKKDDNDAKKDDPWSLSDKQFLHWAKDRLDNVPKHNGYDTAGIERAISYLEKFDKEISNIMRSDIDGKIDSDEVANVREEIEKGIHLLKTRLEKIKDSKKKTKTKKADIEFEIIKEAQKITGVKGTYVTVPLLISGIARVCVNGVVSAGHNLDNLFNEQVKKYKLNDREKAELRFLLLDMGYALKGNRGYLPDEEYDTSEGDFDYMSNYQA